MPVFRNLLRSVLLLAVPAIALAAAPITGTVTNGTTHRPSAGDDVVLIRLAQGMQESTRTTTDSRGRFTLPVPDDGLHLVRVTHDKANYFQPAPAGTATVDLTVYNAAEHVRGVATEATVLRLQTDASGAALKVVQNFFVKNDSAPPMTQFSASPFDFYLPEGAVVEGSAALAPGGMPVQATPVPLAEKNHFAFLFPIRPGETRFQVSYHIPYSGKLQLDPHPTTPTDTIAIMLPKAMAFTPAAGSPFSPAIDEPDAQTFVARSVTPGQPTAFTLSGKGELPRDSQNPAAGEQSSGPSTDTAATDNTAPGKGLDNPLDPTGTRDPWSKYKWWILAGLALLLAVAAGILLRKPTATTTASATPGLTSPTSSAAPNPAGTHAHLLTALKDELFALETDRLQGKISEADYAQTKSALELILRRALNRTA